MSELLENWLRRATKYLAAESREQVRREIEAHYESACEEAMAAGASAEQADRAAVALLGDPAAANRAYRKVLINVWEAQALREMNGVWIGWRLNLLLLSPILVLIAGIRFFATADAYFGWTLLTGAIGIGILFSGLWLPVYTSVRGRIFRAFRLIWLTVVLGLNIYHTSGSWIWHLMPLFYFWQPFLLEWQLFSLRRKLPVSQWPKQLYL